MKKEYELFVVENAATSLTAELENDFAPKDLWSAEDGEFHFKTWGPYRFLTEHHMRNGVLHAKRFLETNKDNSEEGIGLLKETLYLFERFSLADKQFYMKELFKTGSISFGSEEDIDEMMLDPDIGFRRNLGSVTDLLIILIREKKPDVLLLPAPTPSEE